LLEESAQQLYKEWFVRFRFPGHEHIKIIDGAPEGWKKTTADQAINILSGGTPKTTVPDYWDGDIGFYTPKDSTNTVYVSNTEKTITSLGLEKCASKLYPKDTLFITARGTVGKLNLAQTPMAMNQSCYALVGKEPVTQTYLFFAMQAGIQQVKSRAVGAVFDAIIKDTFQVIPFIEPPERLIKEFTDFAKPILDQIDSLLTSGEKLAQARDILLPKLMSGEVAV
jgi:type I restriction enzyme S subunit